tara:strand:- start:363 stop:2030 length:1668 start_codon:yes stop_codon:yes gene_type:complete
MGILRTDVISHSQLSDGNGSVLFDGTTDSITIPSHSALAFRTNDWTVEGWFYFTDLVGDGNGQQTLVGDTYGNTAGFYIYKQINHRLGVYYSSLLVDGTATIEADRWYHLAFVRHSGRTRIYIDGELDAEGADTTDATITQYYIGDTADTSSGEFFGYMSNLRITRNAVYKNNFTVPKFKLKATPDTILLCCQSSSSTTETTVSVPGTLTANGDPTATNFGPGLKDDITDTGVVFDGFANFATSTYMVPPSGKTTERNRGRGIIAGGCTPLTSSIDSFNIQSQGNSVKFGSLHNGAIFGNQMCASSTRGISGGGAQPSVRNFLDFITIATESNSTDFGDLQNSKRDIGALSNQTRGIWTGGNPGSSPNTTDQIDLVTIASVGNATDFGNLTASMKEVQSTSSPTRGIMGGGNTVPATINTIQFITIASTGNASDFGDLTRTASSLGAVSSGTRGVFANGGSNTIDFVTIASAGNALDFGDSTLLRAQCTATMSNSIRGVFAGGYQPSPNSTDTNTVDFITIESAGNAQDFGDISRSGNDSNREGGGCSDSHGGLE